MTAGGNPGASLQIGCALLSKTQDGGYEGIASLSGQPAFHLTTLDSLRDAGGVWVVSILERDFFLSGLPRHEFLRHSGFLPTPLTALMEEVAPPDRNMDISVQRASEIVSRTVELADQAMGGGVSKAIRSGGPESRTFVGAIQRAAIPALRREPMPSELAAGLPSMFEAPSPLGATSGNDVAIRVPANRVALAELVLGGGVPGSTWVEVPESEYPNPLSWAIGGRRPIIARVSVGGLLPGVRATAPLLRNMTRNKQRWMALPEILALSKLVELRATKVMLAEELVPVQATLRIPPPRLSSAAMGSISAGLLAEGYLHAACSASTSGIGLGDQGRPYSVRAAWLYAAARALMLQEAQRLALAGFSVIGFGPTHLMVAAPRKDLKLLRKALSKPGLLGYPTGLRFQEEKLKAPTPTHLSAVE